MLFGPRSKPEKNSSTHNLPFQRNRWRLTRQRKRTCPTTLWSRNSNIENPEPEISVPPAQNFRITDEHLGEGGPKQKFACNIEAIRTLQAIETEGRSATPEEQTVLSQYVGWGGLADAFDPDKDSWAREYTQLKELLTPEEYAAARASTLNAPLHQSHCHPGHL